MPYVDKGILPEPDKKDKPIWRYLDSTQFISLLQNRKLYFARTDKFRDPFEGIPPIKNLEEMRRGAVEYNKGIEDRIQSGDLPRDIGEFMKTSTNPLEDLAIFRASSFLNCWSMRNRESMGMWESFINSGDGVVIKSTYNKLKRALDPLGEIDFQLGEVQYIDIFEEQIDPSNLRYPFAFKHDSYEEELEIRAMLYKLPFDKTEDVRPGKRPSTVEQHPTGIPVKVDIRQLIDEIRLSPLGPSWSTVEFWQGVRRKYRPYTFDIERSELSVTPEEILEVQKIRLDNYIEKIT